MIEFVYLQNADADTDVEGCGYRCGIVEVYQPTASDIYHLLYLFLMVPSANCGFFINSELRRCIHLEQVDRAILLQFLKHLKITISLSLIGVF